MVRTSGIRDKLRSDVLKELAKERGIKRSKPGDGAKEDVEATTSKDKEHDEEDETETLNRLNQERRMKRARESKSSLLSLLPEPKNSSAFGATIRLDKLLKMPERADNVDLQNQQLSQDDLADESCNNINDDGMLEVDVNKYLTDPTPSTVKDLTIEKAKPGAVIVPKGKEKQKNQITYLAQLGKATELERKEQAAQGRANRSAARSKYGW